MQTFLTVLLTIILLGAVQGFILSALLFFSSRKRRPSEKAGNRPPANSTNRSVTSERAAAEDRSNHRRLSNRLLAVLIFLISLASFKLYGAVKGWFDTNYYLRLLDAFVPLTIAMPIGPLIFFYIKSFLDPGFRLTKKDRLQFWPVIIDAGPQLIAITYFIGLLTNTVRNHPQPWGLAIDTYNVYADIPRWISLSYYVILSARYVRSVRSGLYLSSLVSSEQLHWPRQVVRLFIAFQVIWLIYLIPYVIPRYTDWILNTFDWYPLYVPMAVIIYWIGIKGYLLSFREWPAPARGISLPAGTLQQAISALLAAMEPDRLWLDPDLSVATLASHTGLASKTISAVLNQHLHKSFNEFINEYRINAIKQRLLQGEASRQTIAALAYECGFNSLPTFQRAFKTVLGQTPREFLSKSADRLGQPQ